jgi:hypothetical protein
MASISFTLPTPVANFLNLNVPGFAAASGGGSTVALQVPSSALPAPVVAGLSDAGIQIPSGAAAGGGAPAAVPANASGGLAQFAPAGLAPQGPALEDPNLAGAAAFAQALGQQASSFFQQAANGGPISQEQFASFAAQQNQAVHDFIFGA